MRKAVYILLGLVLLLSAVYCGIQIFKQTYSPPAVLSQELSPVIQATPEPVQAFEATAMPEETAAPYVSPVDFAALKAINPDIYAWLDIPGTDISYPVLQSPNDNTYYLNHNSDGEYAAGGSIFSEDYNTTGFSDPVTVLYGHNLQSGAMFGNLERDYSNGGFLAEHGIVRIYTETEELEYVVFAAVPYSNAHLLYENDFSNATDYAAFFQGVFNVRSLDAQFRAEYAPEPGDRVLILSTCLSGDFSRRFLVMAALAE